MKGGIGAKRQWRSTSVTMRVPAHKLVDLRDSLNMVIATNAELPHAKRCGLILDSKWLERMC